MFEKNRIKPYAFDSKLNNVMVNNSALNIMDNPHHAILFNYDKGLGQDIYCLQNEYDAFYEFSIKSGTLRDKFAFNEYENIDIIRDNFNKFVKDIGDVKYIDSSVDKSVYTKHMTENHGVKVIQPHIRNVLLTFKTNKVLYDMGVIKSPVGVRDKVYNLQLKEHLKHDSCISSGDYENTKNFHFIMDSHLKPYDFGTTVKHLFIRLNRNTATVDMGNRDEMVHLVSIYSNSKWGDVIVYNPSILNIENLAIGEFPLYNKDTGNIECTYRSRYDAHKDEFYMEIMKCNRGAMRDATGWHKKGFVADISEEWMDIKYNGFEHLVDINKYTGYKPLYKFDIVIVVSPKYNGFIALMQSPSAVGGDRKKRIGYNKKMDKWFLLDDQKDCTLSPYAKGEIFSQGVADNEFYHVDTITSHLKDDDIVVGIDESAHVLLRDKYKAKLTITYLNGTCRETILPTMYVYGDIDEVNKNKLIQKLVKGNIKPLYHPMKELQNNRVFHSYVMTLGFENIIETYGVRALKPIKYVINKAPDECELGDIYYATTDSSTIYILQLKNEYAQLLDCKAIEYTDVDELTKYTLEDHDIPAISIPSYDVSNVIKKATIRISSYLNSLDIIKFVEEQEEFNIYFHDSIAVGNCQHGTLEFGLKLLNSPDLTVNRYTDLPIDDNNKIIEMCLASTIYCNKAEVLFGLKMDNMAFKTTVANKMLQIKNKGENQK